MELIPQSVFDWRNQVIALVLVVLWAVLEMGRRNTVQERRKRRHRQKSGRRR